MALEIGQSAPEGHDRARKAFAMQRGFEYPLPADFQPRGPTAATFGLFLEDQGIPDRATVVIDAEGKIAHLEVHAVPNQRDVAKNLEVLASL